MLITEERIQQIESHLSDAHQINESIYAELFNINMAEAIKELQTLTMMKVLEPINFNNQIWYIKSKNKVHAVC